MKRPGIRVAFSVAWTDEAGESVFRVNPPSMLLPHKQNVIRRSSADIITREYVQPISYLKLSMNVKPSNSSNITLRDI